MTEVYMLVVALGLVAYLALHARIRIWRRERLLIRRVRRVVEQSASVEDSYARWTVLGLTQDGVGGLLDLVRQAPTFSEDEFFELMAGNLYDIAWHQGTIYACTPFAVREVLKVAPLCGPERRAQLMKFVEVCLVSEESKNVHLAAYERRILAVGNITLPTVRDVVEEHVRSETTPELHQ